MDNFKKIYSDKLKDPRWQKIRLKIFERDEWACRECSSKENTLHVHHRYYEKNVDPWDYPLDSLITLCAYCHLKETESMKINEKLFIKAVKKNFLAEQILELANAFSKLELMHVNYLVSSVIAFSITNPKIQLLLIENYYQHLAFPNRETLLEHQDLLNIIIERTKNYLEEKHK